MPNTKDAQSSTALAALFADAVLAAFPQRIYLEGDFEELPAGWAAELSAAFARRSVGDTPLRVRFVNPELPITRRRLMSQAEISIEFPFNSSLSIQLLYIHAMNAPRSVVDWNNTFVTAALTSGTALILRTGGLACTFDLANTVITADSVSYCALNRGLQLPGGETFVEKRGGFGDGWVKAEFFGQRGAERWLLEIVAGQIDAARCCSSRPKYPALQSRLLGGIVGEVGFGTNPNAESLPIGCLFEKVAGTVHIGVDLVGKLEVESHVDLALVETSWSTH